MSSFELLPEVDQPCDADVECQPDLDKIEGAVHFKAPTSDTTFESMSRKTFAENTDKKIGWAVSLFQDWRQHRIKYSMDDGNLTKIMWTNIDDAKSLNKSHLCYTLGCFVNEVKRKDGGEYPGKTIYDLVICV